MERCLCTVAKVTSKFIGVFCHNMHYNTSKHCKAPNLHTRKPFETLQNTTYTQHQKLQLKVSTANYPIKVLKLCYFLMSRLLLRTTYNQNQVTWIDINGAMFHPVQKTWLQTLKNSECHVTLAKGLHVEHVYKTLMGPCWQGLLQEVLLHFPCLHCSLTEKVLPDAVQQLVANTPVGLQNDDQLPLISSSQEHCQATVLQLLLPVNCGLSSYL